MCDHEIQDAHRIRAVGGIARVRAYVLCILKAASRGGRDGWRLELVAICFCVTAWRAEAGEHSVRPIDRIRIGSYRYGLQVGRRSVQLICRALSHVKLRYYTAAAGGRRGASRQSGGLRGRCERRRHRAGGRVFRQRRQVSRTSWLFARRRFLLVIALQSKKIRKQSK